MTQPSTQAIRNITDYSLEEFRDLPYAQRVALCKQAEYTPEKTGELTLRLVDTIVSIEALAGMKLVGELMSVFEQMDPPTAYRTVAAFLKTLEKPGAGDWLKVQLSRMLDRKRYLLSHVMKGTKHLSPPTDKPFVVTFGPRYFIQDPKQIRYRAQVGDAVIVELPKDDERPTFVAKKAQLYHRTFIPAENTEPYE